ncbi:MAG: cold shock domain-containing protein, partial [Rubripirellula sp.]
EAELWVEFELDEEHLEENQRLRASVVRPTTRPSGRKLSGRDATFRIVTHHDNARRKRPTWRK